MDELTFYYWTHKTFFALETAQKFAETDIFRYLTCYCKQQHEIALVKQEGNNIRALKKLREMEINYNLALSLDREAYENPAMKLATLYALIQKDCYLEFNVNDFYNKLESWDYGNLDKTLQLHFFRVNISHIFMNEFKVSAISAITDEIIDRFIFYLNQLYLTETEENAKKRALLAILNKVAYELFFYS